jgi:serine/threonine-protein kinase
MFEIDVTSEGMSVRCPHCNEVVALPGEDELSEGTTIGGFVIMKLVGKGGMGNVYLAYQSSMQREVALKILPKNMTQDKEAVEQFLNEVKMSGQLMHPNVIIAFDAGEIDGTYYLAMNYIEGESLEDLLEKGKKFSEKTALEYCVKIADALEHAWDQHEMFHKDIKPGNIMIDSKGEPFLLDMGIAQRIGQQEEKKELVEGSPFYMSPEQSRGEPLSWSTDLYSLGATLYNLVVGVPPYDHKDIMKILEMHTKAPFPMPNKRNPKAKVSPEMIKLLKTMIGKIPEDRFSSWAEFKKAARKIINKGKKEKSAANNKTTAGKTPAKTSARTSTGRAGSKKRSTSFNKLKLASKKKSPALALWGSVAMIIVVLLGVLLWLKIKSQNDAEKAIKEAKEYVLRRQYDKYRALKYFRDAKVLSENFMVNSKCRENAEREYNRFKKLVDEQEIAQKAFEKNFAQAQVVAKDAFALFNEAQKLKREQGNDQGKLKEAAEKAVAAINLLRKAPAVAPMDKGNSEALEERLELILKSLKGSYRRKRGAHRKPDNSGDEEEVEVENKPADPAKVKKAVDEVSKSIFLKCVSLGKEKDFKLMARECELAMDKLGACRAKESDDFRLFIKKNVYLPARKAASLWDAASNSQDEVAGVELDLPEKAKGTVEKTDAGEVYINTGNESVCVDMTEVSILALVPLLKKASEKSGGNEALIAVYMFSGEFKAASGIASDEKEKEALSTFTFAYLKASVKIAVELGEDLTELQGKYGELPEYQKAVEAVNAAKKE